MGPRRKPCALLVRGPGLPRIEAGVAIMQKLDNVAAGVENVTKSFTGFKIDTLVGPLREFITANKDPLTATFSNLQAISSQVSSQVAQGKGTLGKLIPTGAEAAEPDSTPSPEQP